MRNLALHVFFKKNLRMEGRGSGRLAGLPKTRTLFFVSAFILPMNAGPYAEEGQSSLLNMKFESQRLFDIDVNNSRQENQAIFRRNQRYLRDALESYSKQMLRSIGLPDQTVDLMGATCRLATEGAKLNLNASKTLAVRFKKMATHDRALYLGYSLDW